jgi:hypothetical protein
MKTSHTNTADNAANSNARIHSILAIVGIVTAIICSLVLLKDHTSQKEASAISLTKASMSSIIKTQDLSLISKIENIIKF